MAGQQTAESLAIDGGEPIAADFEVPDWPTPADNSLEYVQECVESGAWCRLNGDATFVETFEEAYATYHDADHGIAVANGTVAIELALRMCGIEPGDEVLVPAYTFIATAGAVACMGGVPRFVDVDPRTCNLDPDAVREAITEDTVGIVGVHFGGYPMDLDELTDIVDEHGLFFIEDAAHAHGTEWRGEKVGTFGEVGTFSFQASKCLTAGEGGIVLTDDDLLAEDGELLHNIGRVPGKPGYRHYVLSSNYRMAELQAALLTAQFEAFPDEFERRAENAQFLDDALSGIPGIEIQPPDERITQRGYANYTAFFDPAGFEGVDRDTFVDALSAEGIHVGTGYGHPLTEQPAVARERLRSMLPEGVDVPFFRHQSLPGTREVIGSRLSFSQRYLLADRADLELLPAAIEKVRDNVEELR